MKSEFDLEHFINLIYNRTQVFTYFRIFFNKCSESDPHQADNKVLLISIDGLMNEYLDRNETPNFDRFISEGVKAEKMIPVFPTKTFSNHFTIVTGLYDENHGVISNSFPDPNLEGYFSNGPQNSENDERWRQGEAIG